MLTNNKVSVLRCDNSLGEYAVVGSGEGWVFCKSGISGSTKGDENADIVHIRIRKEDVEAVKVGDLVFVGKPEGEKPELAKCRKVTRVANNQFGTVPHWHIEVGA